MHGRRVAMLHGCRIVVHATGLNESGFSLKSLSRAAYLNAVLKFRLSLYCLE